MYQQRKADEEAERKRREAEAEAKVCSFPKSAFSSSFSLGLRLSLLIFRYD